ncbi:MAG: septum site-determining protein MinC [Gammaproteobacteria bacterium 28-57-27]|nr:MAG: septum site-determining protein MinC [Gammaproteobacteria bacterium 28-57-27]
MNASSHSVDDTDTAAKSSFLLKRRAHNLMIFELHNPNIVQLALRLKDHMSQAPNLFKNTPTVLDLAPLEDGFKVIDFPALTSLLDNHGLTIVGISGGTDAQRIAAARARLALFSSAGHAPPTEPQANPAQAEAPAATPEVSPNEKPIEVAPACASNIADDTASNIVLRQTVRAGQQVYARGGDLIVEASVNEGSEVIADGDIHIYGTLRGRALAGARGRKDARIWCHNLDAELVSINGIYRTRDSIEPDLIGKAAVIEIQQEKLIIRPLG